MITVTQPETIDLTMDLDGIKWVHTSDATIVLMCPHCGQAQTDTLETEWEYIADDDTRYMECENCNNEYEYTFTPTATIHLQVAITKPV